MDSRQWSNLVGLIGIAWMGGIFGLQLVKEARIRFSALALIGVILVLVSAMIAEPKEMAGHYERHLIEVFMPQVFFSTALLTTIATALWYVVFFIAFKIVQAVKKRQQ